MNSWQLIDKQLSVSLLTFYYLITCPFIPEYQVNIKRFTIYWGWHMYRITCTSNRMVAKNQLRSTQKMFNTSGQMEMWTG